MSVGPIQVRLPDRPVGSDECGLCLESTPQPLPCSHTFCLSCLSHVLSSRPQSASSFPCPTCRSPTHIPPGGVESLRRGFNWELRNVVQPLEKTFSKNLPKNFSAQRIMTTLSEQAKMPQERACDFHSGEVLRFYCVYCRTPICRDCKLTYHEGHKAVNLSEKSADLKTLILLIMKMSSTSLEPKLRQTLEEAKKQKKKLEEKNKKILVTLEERKESLKKEIDQIFSKATEELNEKTAQVDQVITKSVDSMTQGLGLFLSFSNHVENVTSHGCNADVVNLLPQVTKFFKEACQQATESFEILEENTHSYFGETCSLAQDGALRSFLTDEWREDLELSENTSTKDCPFCTFKYPKKAVTCPMCYTGRSKTPANKTPAKNIFGFMRGKPSQGTIPQIQCQTCSLNYDATCDICPSCFTPSAQDDLTTIQNLISQYIGHVSQIHQSEAKEEAESGRRKSPTGSPRSGSPNLKDASRRSGVGDLVYGLPTMVGRRAWEIYNAVATIACLLQDQK
ncbi:hypothetical protein ACOMHN_066325 [Nucella lapillus]